MRRRIIVQCNTAGRDLGGIVAEIQQRLAPIQASLPTGYFIQYSGQFESQQSATRTIGLLGLVSLACMLLTLYTLFHSFNLSLQVLAAPADGGHRRGGRLVVTGQSLTVASMVGFISLAGIASRNGILLDRPLPALGPARRRSVHAADDRAGRQGAARPDADDGA